MTIPTTGPGLDDLVEGGDPLECPACVADGVECEFHRGWAEGWDACAALVARSVDEQRAAELDPANWTLWRDDELDAGEWPCQMCGGHGTVPCGECDGSGDERGAWSAIDPCAACDGTGDEPCPECSGGRS